MSKLETVYYSFLFYMFIQYSQVTLCSVFELIIKNVNYNQKLTLNLPNSSGLLYLVLAVRKAVNEATLAHTATSWLVLVALGNSPRGAMSSQLRIPPNFPMGPFPFLLVLLPSLPQCSLNLKRNWIIPQLGTSSIYNKMSGIHTFTTLESIQHEDTLLDTGKPRGGGGM